MKFVYVIVSKEQDYIVEQALLSMYSLKMYNPKAHIVAVMDKNTFDNLEGERSKIKIYIDEYITPQLPGEFSATQKSRFLKTSLRSLVQGDFLYIDIDTIITDKISDYNFEGDLAAVYTRHRSDWHVGFIPSMMKEYLALDRDLDKCRDIQYYFNGGVLYCKDSEISSKFFEAWHEFWLKDSLEVGFHKDQPAMWRANFILGNPIVALPGTFNCQIHYPSRSLIFIPSARIIHYFSSSDRYKNFIFKEIAVLKKIREEGLNKEIENHIRNIKSLILADIMQLIGNMEKEIKILSKEKSNKEKSKNKKSLISKIEKFIFK